MNSERKTLTYIYFLRWDVCAEFINQHSNSGKTAKEVLAKAKEMQSGNFAMSSLKEEVNKMAYENLQKSKKLKLLIIILETTLH